MEQVTTCCTLITPFVAYQFKKKSHKQKIILRVLLVDIVSRTHLIDCFIVTSIF